MTLRVASVAAALLFPVLAGSAVAQTAPQSVPQGSPLPRVLPPGPAATSPGAATPALPPSGAEVPNRSVLVTDVAIEGATAFPQSELASYTAGLTGPAVPLPKIDAARQAILKHYRSQGYVLTTVSVSLNAAGHLRFIITEGHIASVKLDGDIGPAGTRVLRFLHKLTEHTPIDSATLERYLLLAQDVPGVTLHAVLQPSTDEPGALNLIAQVSRKPVSGLFSMDNRAFDLTGPIEALGVLDLNSFTSLGERTELSIYHTFPNTQTFGQASLEAFVGDSGLRVKVYGGYGDVNPSGILGEGGYHGTTTVFGGQASYPVIRSRQEVLNVTLSLDALESLVDNGIPPSRASYDSLRVLRLGEDYTRSDLLFGPDHSAVNYLSVKVSKGLPILGAQVNTASYNSPARLGENTSFTKIAFEASRTQTLFTPWTGASVALMELLTGQWSGDILPPAEQFYLGGARFTRGYYAGQVPGDKALAATTELQLNTGFDLSSFGLSTEVSTQFYLFYDWGETWQNQPTDFATRIASAGGGARFQITQHTELDLEALGRFNLYPTGTAGSTGALNGIGLFWR
ncbi:MAG TPA: ShlB/FhaC/HecB family hemolysin secretion/activation protein, partial [Acetobacteraceae bacterium]|nr:ShlB/FhaC/HecB family hemolysin secretion/activation protein [Acetobacteraceae bacterium]